MSSRLRISEIFSSIQGEGIRSGIPSTFVRVSGCNLRCVWCDTPYASWNPEGPVMNLDDILDQVPSAIRDVVVTGGEPMIFEPVVQLCEVLHSRGHHITIETAGTVFRELQCDLMSISPKLSHSTPVDDPEWEARHERDRLNISVLTQLINRYEVQLKFVVNPETGRDLDEIDALLAQLPAVPADRILLMPEGTQAAVLHARQKKLVPLCMERGWRLSPRLHIDLFGNTKGT